MLSKNKKATHVFSLIKLQQNQQLLTYPLIRLIWLLWYIQKYWTLPTTVCASNVILINYKKGNLSPTEKDKTYEGSTIISPYDPDMPGIEPLDNTPGKINIDQRLASVLGHEMTTAPANKPVSRCRRHPPPPLNDVSNAMLQTRSCFWIGWYPNLLNRKKRKYPPSRSKAKSVSFEIRKWHFATKKNWSKTPRNYSIRLMTEVIQWTQRITNKLF